MEALVAQLSRTLDELQNLQPNDRMGYLTGLMRSVNAVAMTCGGWEQFLKDYATIEKFEETALKRFFDHFRETAVKRLEFDIKILTDYAHIIRERFGPISERPARQRTEYVR